MCGTVDANSDVIHEPETHERTRNRSYTNELTGEPSGQREITTQLAFAPAEWQGGGSGGVYHSFTNTKNDLPVE